jgi:predicted O-methyltransferase YrrM
MEQWKLIKRHWKYYWRAKTKSQIQNKFVLEFLDNTVETTEKRPFFEDLETLRATLKKDESPLIKQDLGAGATSNPTQNTTVASLAKSSQSFPVTAQFLFRLTNWLQPRTMVELGTSLGIATIYQALGAESGKMYSIEGCPETTAVARKVVQDFEVANIKIEQGNFDDLLPIHLKKIKHLDYIFIDGNHLEKPTIAYFEMCLPFIHEDSVMVFHDIRWSEGMAAAWEFIQKHKTATLTIEIYDVGLVFFKRNSGKKQDFSLLPKRFKPF